MKDLKYLINLKHISFQFTSISSKVSNPEMIARRVKRKCLNWWNRSLVTALASHLVYEKNSCAVVIKYVKEFDLLIKKLY